tara:strand:+ start:2153 stop:2377 length:225 start_codon:yes stop_codon:yes gene_type:complete
MDLYEEYLDEIQKRKKQGLCAKPIDNGVLAREIISHVKSPNSKQHNQCVDFLIFNMLPGTTKQLVKRLNFLSKS